MFERNESTADRVVRLGLGAFLVGVALQRFSAHRRPVVAGLVGLAGAVLLFTAATGSCLVYRPFGISTYSE